MSGARLWIERLAQCEVEGGTFMLALESGGETISLAMTPHMARRLSERSRMALTEWERDRGQRTVVELTTKVESPQ